MKLATTSEDFNRFCETRLEDIKCVHKAGFKYIDFSLYSVSKNEKFLLSDNWREEILPIKEYASANGIEFVQCHSPGLNPKASSQEFEKAVKMNIRSIEICGELGIPNMVIHAGGRSGLQKKEWFEEGKAFFEKLFPQMEKYGVNVLHENGYPADDGSFVITTGSGMREFSEYINHPLFHSCWDTGHANISGAQYDHILAMGEDLRALHINDNRGELDEHTIPFFGTVNMDEIISALKKIGYTGAFTFEACNALRPGSFWVGSRRTFSDKTLLMEPCLELQLELEKFMYKVGKYMLEAYGEFEG